MSTRSIFHDAPQQLVHTRARWDEEWTPRPELYCTQMRDSAAPTVPTAALELRHGVGLLPEQQQFAIHEPLDVIDHWVRVTVLLAAPAQPLRWYGRLISAQRLEHGRLADALGEGQGVASGVTQYAAEGLAAELERARVTTCRQQATAVPSEDDAEPAGEQTLGRALPFNLGAGRRGDMSWSPNASPEPGEQGVKIFAEWPDVDGAPWTVREILDYLLIEQVQRDPVSGQRELPWQLEAAEGLLEWFQPRQPAAGYTLAALVSALVDRRRLLGWTVDVVDQGGESAEEVRLRVFSFAAEAIELDEEHTLPANGDPQQLDYTTALDVDASYLREDTAHRVDQVVVWGGLRTSTATFSVLDESLEHGWTSAERVEYEAAASEEEGYDDLKRAAQEERNLEVRQHPRLAHVFRRLRVPRNWSGTTKGGTALEEVDDLADPRIDPETGGITEEATPWWTLGIRFARELALLENHDYAGAQINSGSFAEPLDPDLPSPPRPPLVCLRVEDAPEEEWVEADVEQGEEEDDGRRWCAVELLAEQARSPRRGKRGGREWACDVLLLDDLPGLDLVVRGGPQHLLGGGEWHPLPVDRASDLDYNTVWATLTWETDERASVRYPPDVELPVGHARRLDIDAGEDYRLDYVAPRTIVALAGGRPQRTDYGGFVRDDRPRLERLARVAWSWYQRPRRALELSYRQIARIARVGHLITHVGGQYDSIEVSAIVTLVEYDLVHGRSVVRTDFGELDVRVL